MSVFKKSVQFLIVVGFVMVLATAVRPTRAAADRYVSPAGADKGDCSSITSPCATIAYAVAQALPLETIALDSGTFFESGIVIDKDLTIQGSGAANTVIDAGGSGSIFTVDTAVTSFALEKMTLTNAGSRALSVPGGAAAVDVAGVTMTANPGGAISFHSSGTLTVKKSDLSGNVLTVGQSGGAISGGSAGAVVVSGSTLSNNVAGGSGRGGAIRSAGDVTILNSVIDGNEAQAGGGIWMDTVDPLLIVRDSTISNNEATLLQGGDIFSDGDIRIVRSTVANNVAHPTNGIGGGIGTAAYSVGEIMVVNSTFSGNSAGWGAGIAVVANATARIASSTFYGNDANLSGSAIYALNTLDMSNTIVSNNAGNECFVMLGLVPTGDHNLVDDATCGSAASYNLGAVTNLDGTLQNNGGATQTHALLAGSNAIDAGFDLCRHPLSGNPLRADQRKGSYGRPVDGDANGVAVCDIGSYELQ